MDIKRFLTGFLTVITTLIGLSYFTSQDASANTNNLNDELISQVEIFDENDEKIPYTTDELKEIIKFVSDDSIIRQEQRSYVVTPRSISNYTYKSGAFNFSNNIWINGGGTFRNPVDVRITPKGTAKPFTFFVFRDNGTQYERFGFPGGWTGETHISLTHLTRNYKYKFQFVNYDVSASKLYFTNAKVNYDG